MLKNTTLLTSALMVSLIVGSGVQAMNNYECPSAKGAHRAAKIAEMAARRPIADEDNTARALFVPSRGNVNVTVSVNPGNAPVKEASPSRDLPTGNVVRQLFKNRQ